jgi:hypothetical protein
MRMRGIGIDPREINANIDTGGRKSCENKQRIHGSTNDGTRAEKDVG